MRSRRCAKRFFVGRGNFTNRLGNIPKKGGVRRDGFGQHLGVVSVPREIFHRDIRQQNTGKVCAEVSWRVLFYLLTFRTVTVKKKTLPRGRSQMLPRKMRVIVPVCL